MSIYQCINVLWSVTSVFGSVYELLWPLMMVSCAVHLEACNESLHFQIYGVLAYSLTEALVMFCVVKFAM